METHVFPQQPPQGQRPRLLVPGRSFTFRSVVAGLGVGTVICAANVYFGLQTGWVSIMSMPASLMGFGVFRLLRNHLQFPFTPVENVLLQSVACGMAIMPLGCGLVGVIPAMTFLLDPSEQGPISLSMGQLIIWSLGLCYFGVVFAVPLRRQVIIRERLRFPSGFSTAVLISVLHDGDTAEAQSMDEAAKGGYGSLVRQEEHWTENEVTGASESEPVRESLTNEWTWNMQLLLLCFFVSGIFTICTYFLPILRNIPIFGTAAAQTWLWTFNPSLAYVGQGIIMGTETTLHMALGTIIGWAVLSPLAKFKGWAPGPVDDWESGSKGWIIWVSLAIMLVDAVIGLVYIAMRPMLGRIVFTLPTMIGEKMRQYGTFRGSQDNINPYQPIQSDDQASDMRSESSDDRASSCNDQIEQDDAPVDQRISNIVVIVGLTASVLLCVITIHFVFGDLVPLYATAIAVLMALILSIMGVRALGETDLNPVSGISKLAQLFFALIIPQSNKSSVLINLVAGAVSEAGALQAGDLMQDLKTGHLLGASPKAQFWGQVIGATVGAVLSSFIYHLYTLVYQIPGDIFQVPTAYVWLFTARLVTGKGLPPMAKEWAIGAGCLFGLATVARTASVGKPWQPWIPGGIAVAIGMYNVPSFTLARAVGGIFAWYWVQILKRSNTPLIILASGCILGEGFLSIVNLILQGFGVPHY